MKNDLINSGASKLDSLHPRTVLNLTQELHRKNYHSAGVLNVEQKEYNERNTQVVVTLTGFKNDNLKENHIITFNCLHSNDYSCASYGTTSKY